MWAISAYMNRPPRVILSVTRRYGATIASPVGSSSRSSVAHKIAAAVSSSMAVLAGGAYGIDRSGTVTAEEGPAAAAIAAVRFTRALAVSSSVMLDYRILFAQHTDYTSDVYKQKRSAVHSKSADRLLSLCKRQGGVYVKVGQHVASMNHAVPVEFTSKLIQLEDRAAFRPYSQVERVICNELGGRLEDHFATFEREPVAAASLAQVHRATLHGSGDVVACKVQHAGLVTLVAGDLSTIRVLSRLLSYLFPAMSLDWIVDQFQENLKKELDFTKEALSSERTRKFFQDDSRFDVPKIHFGRSTRRVLTMDFISGFRVDDFKRLEAAGISREAVASAVVDAFAKMIFISGSCQCDGHGGNMLVRPRAGGAPGQFDLVLLDHGLYCELDDRFRRAYCRLWRGLVLRLPEEVNRACVELGTPNLGNLFSIFLLNRSWSSAQSLGVDLRNKMSKEELRALMGELRDGGVESGADAASLLGSLPQDLLLVFKMNSLVRNINKTLGAPVDRFKSNVRNAVRGLHHTNMPLSMNVGLDSYGQSDSAAPAGFITSRMLTWLNWRLWEPVACWADIAFVEVNLLLFDVLLVVHRWWNGAASVASGDADKLLG
jgi:aarF domain-containing kinase